MIPPNRDCEVMLWSGCGGRWWMRGMWSRAPWKSSLGSSQHLEDEWCVQEIQLSLSAALPNYNDSGSGHPWGYTVRQNPI